MAKRKVNKSQEIRDYATANPDASAKEIVAALKKKKISVSEATVANVRSKAGLTKRGSKRRKKATVGTGAAKTTGRRRKAASTGHDIPLQTLIEAKKLSLAAGSVENALEAVKAIDRLESLG